jgi:hypothetical protein
MFAIIDPARALDDPEREVSGFHYDHDVRGDEDDCRRTQESATAETRAPVMVSHGVEMYGDGAMWIEHALGGDAPYDLSARFEGDRVVEVSFRIDGIRLGEVAH